MSESTWKLLTFNDIIRPNIYNFSVITFQNAETNPSQQYTLTGGQSLSTDNLGFVITATNTGTGTNLLQLKHRIGLATSIHYTYIAVAVGVNMASNEQPMLPAVAQATSFIRDQTRPSLSAFSFHFNNNTLNVFANEPLNTASYYPLGNALHS